MSEMKKYVVILHMETDEYQPSTWMWDELIGETITNVHVWDVTDEDNLPGRLRITADGVEEV